MFDLPVASFDDTAGKVCSPVSGDPRLQTLVFDRPDAGFVAGLGTQFQRELFARLAGNDGTQAILPFSPSHDGGLKGHRFRFVANAALFDG
jgi:hypothetical protein